jgi:integrase
MTDAEFQALLRVADPLLRRLLIFLKFTGCRPAEALSMRWSNVHWEQSSVVHREHKTAHSTGRPRVIPLVPTVLKMLVWMRQHRQATIPGLVERCLASHGGRLSPRKLETYMRPFGMSVHGIKRALESLNVRKKWAGHNGRAWIYQVPRAVRKVGSDKASWYVAWCDEKQRRRNKSFGPGESGHQAALAERERLNQTAGNWEYVLPDKHAKLPDPTDNDFVWIGCRGNRINRHSLSLKIQRARRRAGLGRHVTPYGLRHRYGLMGIRNGVNLKLLSLCMGHSSVSMTEHYIAEAGLTNEVQAAALQVAFGPNVVSAKGPAAPPRAIPTYVPPPAAELKPISEQLHTRHKADGARPHVPLNGQSQPIPATQGMTEVLIQQLLQKLSEPLPRRQPAAIAPPYLQPGQEKAYRAFEWALQRSPALAEAKDREVYDWLKKQPACPFSLPPQFSTFHRYLGAARLFYDCRKRILRPRQDPPELS